jgi:hypothetical protein
MVMTRRFATFQVTAKLLKPHTFQPTQSNLIAFSKLWRAWIAFTPFCMIILKIVTLKLCDFSLQISF